MKRRVIITAVLVILAINIIGCTNSNNETGIANSNEFEVISTQDIDTFSCLKIVKHKKTGEKFVIFSGANKGGIAKLDD